MSESPDSSNYFVWHFFEPSEDNNQFDFNERLQRIQEDGDGKLDMMDHHHDENDNDGVVDELMMDEYYDSDYDDEADKKQNEKDLHLKTPASTTTTTTTKSSVCATTDKLRLSNLEKELNNCECHLRGVDKSNKFVLALLKILFDWALDTFDAELIDKSSSAYRLWSSGFSSNEIKFIAKSLLKPSKSAFEESRNKSSPKSQSHNQRAPQIRTYPSKVRKNNNVNVNTTNNIKQSPVQQQPMSSRDGLRSQQQIQSTIDNSPSTQEHDNEGNFDEDSLDDAEAMHAAAQTQAEPATRTSAQNPAQLEESAAEIDPPAPNSPIWIHFITTRNSRHEIISNICKKCHWQVSWAPKRLVEHVHKCQKIGGGTGSPNLPQAQALPPNLNAGIASAPPPPSVWAHFQPSATQASNSNQQGPESMSAECKYCHTAVNARSDHLITHLINVHGYNKHELIRQHNADLGLKTDEPDDDDHDEDEEEEQEQEVESGLVKEEPLTLEAYEGNECNDDGEDDYLNLVDKVQVKLYEEEEEEDVDERQGQEDHLVKVAPAHKPCGKKKTLYWKFFKTTTNPTTGKVTSNICLRCGNHVSPKADRLRAHLVKCGKPKAPVTKPQSKKPKRSPSTSPIKRKALILSSESEAELGPPSSSASPSSSRLEDDDDDQAAAELESAEFLQLGAALPLVNSEQQQESQPKPGNNTSPGGVLRRKRTLYWKFFKTTKDGPSGRILNNTCIRCDEHVSPKSGRLRSHLIKCLKPNPKLLRKRGAHKYRKREPSATSKSAGTPAVIRKGGITLKKAKTEKNDSKSGASSSATPRSTGVPRQGNPGVRTIYWNYFDTIKDASGKKVLSNICQNCHRQVSPKADRMRDHLIKCIDLQINPATSSDGSGAAGEPQRRPTLPAAVKEAKKTQLMTHFITRSKEVLDIEAATACNIKPRETTVSSCKKCGLTLPTMLKIMIDHLVICDPQVGEEFKVLIRVDRPRPTIQCEECGKFLIGNLAKHMLIHSNDRPHGCETCGKAFRRKHQLKFHILTVHKGMKFPRRRKTAAAAASSAGGGGATKKRNLVMIPILDPGLNPICTTTTSPYSTMTHLPNFSGGSVVTSSAASSSSLGVQNIATQQQHLSPLPLFGSAQRAQQLALTLGNNTSIGGIRDVGPGLNSGLYYQPRQQH